MIESCPEEWKHLLQNYFSVFNFPLIFRTRPWSDKNLHIFQLSEAKRSIKKTEDSRLLSHVVRDGISAHKNELFELYTTT